MVHTIDIRAWDGEGTHVHLMNEATRKATQNERQRRSRACRRSAMQNVMQNIAQNVLQNVEQNVLIIETNPMLENLIVNLKRSTSRTTKQFIVEWFKMTSTKGLDYQQTLFPKNLRNSI
jgi:hypothetical protein